MNEKDLKKENWMLNQRIKKLEELKQIENPKRDFFKLLTMIAVHSMERIFLNYRRTLIYKSRIEKFQELVQDKINIFFERNKREGSMIENHTNKYTLTKVNVLFFMFLQGDNAYNQLFRNILIRWKKKGVIY